MIKLENDQGGIFHRSSDWFVDKVLITTSSTILKVYEFPCYAWVKRESVFFEGKGKLKQTPPYNGFVSHVVCKNGKEKVCFLLG